MIELEKPEPALNDTSTPVGAVITVLAVSEPPETVYDYGELAVPTGVEPRLMELVEVLSDGPIV